MSDEKLAPVHPGEILREDFLKPMGLSQARLARDLHISTSRVTGIIHGRCAITADTALRLSRYFGTSERFWLNLQNRYDLECQKDKNGQQITREVPILAAS